MDSYQRLLNIGKTLINNREDFTQRYLPNINSYVVESLDTGNKIYIPEFRPEVGFGLFFHNW